MKQQHLQGIILGILTVAFLMNAGSAYGAMSLVSKDDQQNEQCGLGAVSTNSSKMGFGGAFMIMLAGLAALGFGVGNAKTAVSLKGMVKKEKIMFVAMTVSFFLASMLSLSSLPHLGMDAHFGRNVCSSAHPFHRVVYALKIIVYLRDKLETPTLLHKDFETLMSIVYEGRDPGDIDHIFANLTELVNASDDQELKNVVASIQVHPDEHSSKLRKGGVLLLVSAFVTMVGSVLYFLIHKKDKSFQKPLMGMMGCVFLICTGTGGMLVKESMNNTCGQLKLPNAYLGEGSSVSKLVSLAAVLATVSGLVSSSKNVQEWFGPKDNFDKMGMMFIFIACVLSVASVSYSGSSVLSNLCEDALTPDTGLILLGVYNQARALSLLENNPINTDGIAPLLQGDNTDAVLDDIKRQNAMPCSSKVALEDLLKKGNLDDDVRKNVLKAQAVADVKEAIDKGTPISQGQLDRLEEALNPDGIHQLTDAQRAEDGAMTIPETEVDRGGWPLRLRCIRQKIFASFFGGGIVVLGSLELKYFFTTIRAEYNVLRVRLNPPSINVALTVSNTAPLISSNLLLAYDRLRAVEIVQNVDGIVETTQNGGGLLATTSEFESKSEKEKIKYILQNPKFMLELHPDYRFHELKFILTKQKLRPFLRSENIAKQYKSANAYEKELENEIRDAIVDKPSLVIHYDFDSLEAHWKEHYKEILEKKKVKQYIKHKELFDLKKNTGSPNTFYTRVIHKALWRFPDVIKNLIKDDNTFKSELNNALKGRISENRLRNMMKAGFTYSTKSKYTEEYGDIIEKHKDLLHAIAIYMGQGYFPKSIDEINATTTSRQTNAKASIGHAGYMLPDRTLLELVLKYREKTSFTVAELASAETNASDLTQEVAKHDDKVGRTCTSPLVSLATYFRTIVQGSESGENDTVVIDDFVKKSVDFKAELAKAYDCYRESRNIPKIRTPNLYSKSTFIIGLQEGGKLNLSACVLYFVGLAILGGSEIKRRRARK